MLLYKQKIGILIIQYFTRNLINKNKYVDIYDYFLATKERLPMQKVMSAKRNSDDQ